MEVEEANINLLTARNMKAKENEACQWKNQVYCVLETFQTSWISTCLDRRKSSKSLR